MSFSDDFTLLSPQFGIPPWLTNDYVTGDFFNITNLSPGGAFNGSSVYPSGVNTAYLYPSGGIHDVSMLRPGSPDRLNYLRIGFVSPRWGYLEVRNSSGDFNLLLGGEYTPLGANIVLTIGGNTTTIASPVPGLYFMTFELSGVIGARVFKIYVGNSLVSTTSVNDISTPLGAQSVIVNSKQYAAGGTASYLFVQGISTVPPITLPSPDLSIPARWFLRLADTSQIALPVETQPPAQTPGISYSVDTARDATIIAPTVLMPHHDREFQASYTGTFKLDSDAFYFVMNTRVHKQNANEIVQLIDSLNSSFATALKLEYHVEGVIISTAIDITATRRGFVVRNPDFANLGSLNIHVQLLDRDWVNQTSGVHYGAIF